MLDLFNHHQTHLVLNIARLRDHLSMIYDAVLRSGRLGLESPEERLLRPYQLDGGGRGFGEVDQGPAVGNHLGGDVLTQQPDR